MQKLSGIPAQRFGLRQRGTLEEGNYADLVVFDEAEVRDQATFEEPHQYSIGIEHVLVNGVPIVEGSRPVADLSTPLPGRALSFGS